MLDIEWYQCTYVVFVLWNKGKAYWLTCCYCCCGSFEFHHVISIHRHMIHVLEGHTAYIAFFSFVALHFRMHGTSKRMDMIFAFMIFCFFSGNRCVSSFICIAGK